MIQARPLIGLLRAYLLVDLRKQTTGAGPPGGLPAVTPLTLIVWQLLLGGGLLALLLFARVDCAFFTAVTLGFSLLLGALVIIPDLPHLLNDPADETMLLARPVTSVTIRAAHLLCAVLHGGIVMFSLALIPAVLGAGMPDAGRAYFLVYLAVSLGLGTLLVLGLLAFGARWADRSWFHWIQVAPLLGVVIGAQVLFKNRETHPIELLAYHAHPWIEYAPTAWLARFVVEASHDPWSPSLAFALAGLALAAWVLGGLHLSGPGDRDRTNTRECSSPRSPDPHRPGVSSHERAGECLTRRMLERDPAISAAVVPYAGMISTLVVLSLFGGQMGDPLVQRGAAVSGPFLAAYMLAMLLPPLYQVLGTSRDHAAGWIFQVSPLEGPARLRRGMQKVLHARFLMPAMGAYFALFTVLWRNPVHSILFCASSWLVLRFVSDVTNGCFSATLPFTRVPVRFETVGRYVLGHAALGTVLALVGLLHYHASASIVGLVAFSALAALAPWVKGRP